MEELKLKTRDNFNLALAVFEHDDPKAVVQIVHGAKEHKERYYDFCKYLNQNGYAVVISDNRGHGASVDENYPLSYMDDSMKIVDDQHEVTAYINKIYPQKDVYMLGHSLGSMIARVYLQEHDDDIKKLVLSGTANYIGAGKIGIAVSKLIKPFKGKDGYSRLLERFANFLDDSWVVGNEEALQKYRNDPLCTYKYPVCSMKEVFRINQELHKKKKFKVKNEKLPILSVTGELDPVVGGKKGLDDTVRTLNELGYKDVRTKVYKGMYHEVLNERENELVYGDILVFLNEAL